MRGGAGGSGGATSLVPPTSRFSPLALRRGVDRDLRPGRRTGELIEVPVRDGRADGGDDVRPQVRDPWHDVLHQLLVQVVPAVQAALVVGEGDLLAVVDVRVKDRDRLGRQRSTHYTRLVLGAAEGGVVLV